MPKNVYTKDGSITLYSKEFKEHYHSTHGAINESMHVFIQSGLKECSKKNIRILEIGFGTGLNAFLTFLESINLNIIVNYTGIELYPITSEQALNLNYPELLNTNEKENFIRLHTSEWNYAIAISENFTFKKIKTDFNKYTPTEKFDLIYFDAFSPDTQPELWTFDNFKRLFLHLNGNGILVTYSSKGIVKNNLREAGFFVQRLKGPQGKRHILRAIKRV